MSKKNFKNIGQGKDKFKENISSFLVDPTEKKPEGEDNVVFEFSGQEPDAKKAQKPAAKKESKAKPSKPRESKVTPKVTSEKIELPNDFKSHTFRVGDDLLGKIKKLYFQKKAKGDDSLSMKELFYEAIHIRLESKEFADIEYPSVLGTYSVLTSQDQLVKFKEMVYTRKAKKDPKYTIHRALHEALLMYLDEVK